MKQLLKSKLLLNICWIIITLAVVFIFDYQKAYAADYKAFFCPNKQNDISACINDIYTWAVEIGGALAILMIIIAGYSYATSAGDVEKTNKAKEIIVGAITGIMLLLGVVIILNTLKTRVNINDSYQFDATPVKSSTGSSGSNTIKMEKGIVPDRDGSPVETLPDDPNDVPNAPVDIGPPAA